MSYFRFAAMILTSTVVMFGLMYLNTYVTEHIFFSETRTYMAFVMGATMAVIMLGYMWSMYSSPAVNLLIVAGSVVAFALSLWLVRSQVTVGDVSYMRAMIPHHSIAILTSKRADISDPRVRKLADEIIAAQEKEIAEMRFLIDDITAQGDAGEDWPLGHEPAQVATLERALDSVEVAGLDPAAMTPDEIDRALTGPVSCRFQRTVDSGPILAVGAEGQRAVMKLSGQLVPLNAGAASEPGGWTAVFVAGEARLSVRAGEGETAELLFELDQDLRVGYGGFWRCA